MLRPIYFVFLAFLFSCDYGHSPSNKLSGQDLYNQTLSDLLPTGKYEVNFTIQKEYTDGQKKVLLKFYNAIAKNEAWFDSLYKNKDKIDSFQYDKHLGISRIEFDTLLLVFSHPHYPSQKGELTIINDTSNRKVQFKGTGKLSILDSLVINFDDSSAAFGSTHLLKDPSSSISKKYIPANETLISTIVYREFYGNLGSSKLPPNFYKLCIAKLAKSGKTFIDLRGESTQSLPKKEMHLSIVFN